ncbi:hypothetical protein [Marinicella litoralis]|uniref:SprT-like family protein n=1 Tax=Marinicella litoralis TaxID=644220 RepID=A0A4R6XW24_9GAMM|nr:hypothetical protein [Marinicella litoralis]TDR22434.1 hypothetical protein C8D91_0923 [Marinicella litoralis]
MLIDWPYIERAFAEITANVDLLCPLDQWSIQPLKLSATQHKTKYGMADVNGVIYINQAFVGTSAVALLDATIRHELAHLCVGLQHGHDSCFKAIAKKFGANFGRHLKQETAQVHVVIGHKYLLFATIENKALNTTTEILFRRVHRKHAKYLDYKPGRFRYLTIKGQKVLNFRYVESLNNHSG